MGLIDTHTHLYLTEFSEDSATVTGDSVVRRALDAGVDHLVFPNVDLSTVEPMLALAEAFPGCTSMAMGLHPTEVGENYEDALSKIMAILTEQRRRFVAVGEIGIDLYWDKTYRAEQIAVFEKQCQAAIDLDLPIIIHCREGLDETLQVVSQFPTLRGVFHSFGGTVDDVARIREIGDYYFGVNGIVTFKNSKLRDVLPTIGLNRILLETDSPYLAPVPYRGKRNESAYIVSTAHCVADALGVPYDVVAEQTSGNARNLFGLNLL